jgi:CRISPR-associated exonuclease Cas4
VELLPVTELRQWTYCPRVVYFHQVMPGAGQMTFKMREGLRAQDLIGNLEMRRTLREYGLEGAERQFGIWLENEKLGLTGKLDLLLKGEKTAAVVDFKLTSGGVGENHRMQLAGYALLVEAAMGLSVEKTFLFRIPDNKVYTVEVTTELRARVVEVVGDIRRMKEEEMMPEATEVLARCVECEYANYCGDIW